MSDLKNMSNKELLELYDSLLAIIEDVIGEKMDKIIAEDNLEAVEHEMTKREEG